MSHTPDFLPQPPDVLAALREATGSRHAVIDEAMPLSRPAPGLADYRDHLLLLRQWLVPLEQWLARHADGPQAEALLPRIWRLPLLEADLADAALPCGGVAAAEPADLPALRSEPAWRWGVCYVIEGSQLGGAVLHRRLSAALRPHPLRFLQPDEAGPGARWQQFIQALRAQVRTEAELALACQGARDAFDRLLALAAPRGR
ncbi:heme oxygenase [Azoarcus indigens]|uniref:Heme oxygenase n=1 Tax=Azoarcus indigens TaxID=29545 RepID=A0A4R6DTI5_9RHOO|nr:biliverdin-producing heme oxygenase [Azoarcus indigens]NMG64478.1 heme oxygenase [Azoarcus indigens]TDN48417.1 heme oxygenase [Azoarcus indigens]